MAKPREHLSRAPTYNKLEPYTTWEEVFSEAYRLWHLYIESAKPLDVTRLAVRYINRLRLPAPVQLSKYLAAPPVLPPPIPQTIREFLTRVVVFESEHNSSAIITQAVEAALDPTLTPVLLDIDAFREATIAPGDPLMPQMFEELRRLKNDIFFASITEHTVEMYA
ncbi:MAG: TIGR04255 family protein [Acidobacteriia bacterium]|nr:TIGR04255 family protein [Terriglobia bacterium]